jgi:predicted TIM-barrel fold metal-dependent hydrolase
VSGLHPSLDHVVDAHTHLSGSENGESADGILATLDAVDVEKVFVFAPLVDTSSWQLVDTDVEHVRAHNDYCADICSAEPGRLFGFCVLNPSPALGGGDHRKAVALMVEEAKRCYHGLGLRGVKMVPAGWYPNDPLLLPLYEVLAELGMYVVFHVGIFLDAKEGSFCRPAFFELVHQVPTLRAQLAHVGWPWVDETLAVLAQEEKTHGEDKSAWQLRTDVSFGPPADWQLPTWQLALTSLNPARLIYGSDLFWPQSADEYREQYLLPQIGLFETAATTMRVAEEGSPERRELRQQVFGVNAWEHWCTAVREPQAPRKSPKSISTPSATRNPRS